MRYSGASFPSSLYPCEQMTSKATIKSHKKSASSGHKHDPSRKSVAQRNNQAAQNHAASHGHRSSNPRLKKSKSPPQKPIPHKAVPAHSRVLSANTQLLQHMHAAQMLEKTRNHSKHKTTANANLPGAYRPSKPKVSVTSSRKYSPPRASQPPGVGLPLTKNLKAAIKQFNRSSGHQRQMTYQTVYM